jgi:GT2 family glycosyltransferase
MTPMPRAADATPSIAIIVLNWNGRDLTLDCLRSLEAVSTPGLRTILVDNASTDGSVDAVRQRYGDRITVIVNEDNLGFAAGNNVGIRRALGGGADFILLLNNDTVVAPDFVDHLLRPMLSTPEIGITAPKIYYAEPKDRIWFAGGEISMWRGVARHTGIRETDRGQYDTERDIDYATGCAFLARGSVFAKIGDLDPGYRAYFEDADFCVRARESGYRIRYIPSAHVWHRISASTGGQLSRRKASRKLASARRFFGRHARPYHWLTIPFFFVLDVIRIASLVLAGRIRDTNPHTPSSSA